VTHFTKEDATHFTCIFVPPKTTLFKPCDGLERKLGQALASVDVIYVHGLLATEENTGS
jgi:hypothetical protein